MLVFLTGIAGSLVFTTLQILFQIRSLKRDKPALFLVAGALFTLGFTLTRMAPAWVATPESLPVWDFAQVLVAVLILLSMNAFPLIHVGSSGRKYFWAACSLGTINLLIVGYFITFGTFENYFAARGDLTWIVGQVGGVSVGRMSVSTPSLWRIIHVFIILALSAGFILSCPQRSAEAAGHGPGPGG
jgi:hypothetical protein